MGDSLREYERFINYKRLCEREKDRLYLMRPSTKLNTSSLSSSCSKAVKPFINDFDEYLKFVKSYRNGQERECCEV
jgi:hypothetical protein